jgi:hypothetical protein
LTIQLESRPATFVPIDDLRPTDRIVRREALVRTRAASAIVVVAYFVIGCVAFWPALPRLSDHLLSGYGDLALTSWFIGWVPHSLAHGLNPFFTNALFVPTGVNLAQNTEAPLLGLVMAPITIVFGPIVSTNLIMVVAMPISATAAFVVLRKWKVWIPAAALGGLVYGFSPYMIGQAAAHPVFIFTPIPPFIALTVEAILNRRGSPRRLGIQLGLLIAAQYLISQELLATVALVTFVAIACVLIRRRSEAGSLLRSSAMPTGIALVVATAILAYPVWMLAAGPQHVPGPAFARISPYRNDLFSFVLPGPLQRVSLGLRTWSDHVVSSIGATEAGAYIGLPLLVLGGFLALRSRRSPHMQLAVFLGAVAALFSLGPRLAVYGHLTQIPLPFWLLDHLPLLDNLLPSRLSFEIVACLSAVLAFGLDDLHRQRVRTHAHSRARWGPTDRKLSIVLASLTLVVLVVTFLPRWPYQTQVAPRLPAAVLRAIPSGDPVAVTYPYDTAFLTAPMMWQVDAGYSFRLLGGYAYRLDAKGEGSTTPDLMNPSGLQEFLSGQEQVNYYGPPLALTPDVVAATLATIAKFHIGMVLVDDTAPGSGPVQALFDDALGPPRVTNGGFSLWARWAYPARS